MRRTSWWTQAVQNRLIALTLVMIAAIPLLAAPADGWRLGATAFVVEAFAIVLLATLAWRSKWNWSKENLVQFFKTGANTPVLIFSAIALISVATSPHKNYSIQEALRLGAGVLLYFVAAYQFRRSEHLTKLVDVLLFVGAAVSLAAFFQFGAATEDRASGLFGNAQLLASFLVVLIPIAAALALTEKDPNRQLGAQVATVMMIAAMLLTQTRSAWSATSAGVIALVFMVLAMNWRNRKSNLKARKHELVLPVMLLLVAVGFFVLISPQTASIVNRGSALSGVASDKSWQTRQHWFDGAKKMIAERPLTGFGLGLFPYYQSEYTGLGRAGLFGHSASLQETAHNFYLQTAAELGIPALLILLSGIVAFLVLGIRRARDMDAGIRKSLLMGSMAAVVAFAVDGIASPSWQFGQTAVYFWLVLGMGVGCLRPQSKSKEEAQAPASAAALILRPASALGSLGLAALLPTVALAAHGAYIHPVQAKLTPKGAVIVGGTFQQYTLEVLFSDGAGHFEWEDVSTNPKTKFSQVGGVGSMSSHGVPNVPKRWYESRIGENDTPTITGTHAPFGETPVSDTAQLFVHWP